MAVPSIQFICDISPIALDSTSGPWATRPPKMLFFENSSST